MSGTCCDVKTVWMIINTARSMDVNDVYSQTTNKHMSSLKPADNEEVFYLHPVDQNMFSFVTMYWSAMIRT